MILGIALFILGFIRKAYLYINSFGYKIRLESNFKDVQELYTVLEKLRPQIFKSQPEESEEKKS
ncbi:MAG: hypothetical protein QXN49_04895 [Archaeoglobaceae archaeon]